jgi:hypothetical protein
VQIDLCIEGFISCDKGSTIRRRNDQNDHFLEIEGDRSFQLVQLGEHREQSVAELASSD